MTYEFNLAFALWALAGLVVGLLLGRAIWRRSGVTRIADNAANTAALAAARSESEQRSRELVATRDAMRPLAEEVDRLKRELAKAKRPAAPDMLAPAAPVAAISPVGEPVPLAGSGPIVDAAIPDIRRLKGVGDKFAAALEAIGLGSVDRLARLNADEAVDADTRLGAFNGRIARDRLVEQATLLDEGRLTEYTTRFGTL